MLVAIVERNKRVSFNSYCLYENFLSLCTQNCTPMRIVSAREFRGKQKDYLDLAEKERVIIHRGHYDDK